MPEEWTAWALDSDGAIRVGRAVCVATGVAAAGAGAIVLANFMHGKVMGVGLLLVPAVPILAAGQIWVILILVGRNRRGDAGPLPRRFRTGAEHDPRGFLFKNHPQWEANALVVIALLAWLTAITAFPHLTLGGPASPTRRCPYRLVDHGEYTCVSRSTYIDARDAEQRFVCGILCGFFVIQFGIAAGELRTRRADGSPALA